MRSGVDHRALRPSDITFGVKDGVEYIRYCESKSKDKSKTDKEIIISANAQVPERCHFQLCKLYLSKCPPLTDYFYAMPLANWRPSGRWYYTAPLGRNTLSKILSEICKKAGIEGFKRHLSLSTSAIIRPTTVEQAVYQTMTTRATTVEQTVHPTMTTLPTTVEQTVYPTMITLPTTVEQTVYPTMTTRPTTVEQTVYPTVATLPTTVEQTVHPTMATTSGIKRKNVEEDLSIYDESSSADGSVIDSDRNFCNDIGIQCDLQQPKSKFPDNSAAKAVYYFHNCNVTINNLSNKNQ